MPGGDGTGPNGFGPMTGRAAGFCAGYSVPGYMNGIPGRGRGFGWGRGGGRGFGWGRGRGFRGGRGFGWGRGGRGGYQYEAPYGDYYGAPYYGDPYAPQLSAGQEADMLRQQVKAMEEDIKAINKQIGTLEKTAAKEKK